MPVYSSGKFEVIRHSRAVVIQTIVCAVDGNQINWHVMEICYHHHCRHQLGKYRNLIVCISKYLYIHTLAFVGERFKILTDIIDKLSLIVVLIIQHLSPVNKHSY